MVQLIVIVVLISFFISSATAFPLIGGTGTADAELVQVRLTKSNVCKPKYKHKKYAQDLREKAHCK